MLNYDQLTALAGDKPVALGEVGAPPSPDILRKQPRWTWFMVWGDPSFSLRKIYQADMLLTLRELPWSDITEPRMHDPILK